MNDTVILAIDHGTSGVRCSLVTDRGEVLATEREELTTDFGSGGRAEQDPTHWTEAITRTARTLVEQRHVDPATIESVCVSSTFSSTVAVDEAGTPLLACLTWMDSRGAPYIERLMRGFPKVQGYALSKLLRWVRITAGGPTLTGKDDLAHVLLIKHEHPDLYKRTHKFLSSKDYLNLWLTGRFAASFDSMTLFWLSDIRDINNIRYDPGLVRAAGIDPDKLPTMQASHAALGPLREEVAGALGLRPGVTVYTGSPDHQAAGIGSGAVRDYHGHLYVGTSSWIQCPLSFKKTDVLHSIATLPTAMPGKYYCANEQDLAGGCLPFLLKNILFHDNALQQTPPPPERYEVVDQIAADVPAGSHRLMFFPWLNGERTPVDDEAIRGGLINLSTTTTQDHIVRAVMEGVAYNTRWSLHYVEKFIGQKMPSLRIVGGGALSDVWCQIFANVLNRNIERVRAPREANARGAALIAAVGMGRISYDDIAGLVPIERTFSPESASRATYDELYALFVDFYRRNRAFYKKLNRGTP